MYVGVFESLTIGEAQVTCKFTKLILQGVLSALTRFTTTNRPAEQYFTYLPSGNED